MQTETQSARDLFASDYLLVSDNDYNTYETHRIASKHLGVVKLSDVIRESYEDLCGRVFDLMESKNKTFSEFERLLVMQLLAGWGSDAFDTIARELKSREEA